MAIVAARQHGVVAFAQLIDVGMTSEQIRVRVRSGLLHRLHRGVFAVGHRGIGNEGRWIAGALAGGAGAALCSWSSGARWELTPDDPQRVHVAVNRRLRSRAGLAFHRLPLSPAFTTIRYGVPVLTPQHALVDLAAVMSPHQLQRAVHEAEVRGLCRPRQIKEALQARGRQRGCAALREILDMADGSSLPTRSELEDRFLRFLEKHSLPMPVTNTRVPTPRGAYEVDCLWPRARVAVELDGRRYHSGPYAQSRDARKERALRSAGVEVIHVTWADLRDREEELADDLGPFVDREGT